MPGGLKVIQKSICVCLFLFFSFMRRCVGKAFCNTKCLAFCSASCMGDQNSMVVYENSTIDLKWQHPLLSGRKARRKASRTCSFIECMFGCTDGAKNRTKFVTRIQHGRSWGLWNASTRLVKIDLTSNVCSNSLLYGMIHQVKKSCFYRMRREGACISLFKPVRAICTN